MGVDDGGGHIADRYRLLVAVGRWRWHLRYVEE